jgi:putative ABC transport system permease protein
MRALDRKLFRDLVSMRGMVAAIGLVLVGGLSTFVMSLATYQSLDQTRERYYREQRFAEVFAQLVRAPNGVAEEIAAVPGVDRVETRVIAAANLDVAGFREPVTARINSVPEYGGPLLNVPWLSAGRLPAPHADDEVVISAEFAAAHGLVAGSRFHATIKGRRQRLTVTGIALSPEFLYAIPPGALFPDHERYGILWMDRRALATAFEMDGAFNDVSVTLQAGARAEDVIVRLDRILERYGGQGAYDRDDHFSHRFISEELRGLRVMATMFPVIFLGVAAFLLNIVVTRLVAIEREQIATLKAFGYGDLEIGAHYTKLVLAIAALGLAGGIGLGAWFARGMGALYRQFYSFPYLEYVLDFRIAAAAAGITVVAAAGGTALAVWRAVRLPPAVGMRPEAPPLYRPTIVERLGLERSLAEPTRMIIRHTTRRPVKSLLTIAGIAAAGGIIMITNFQRDAIDWMMTVQYGLSAREDMTVLFTDPTPRRALYSLASLPGVTRAEGFRSVPVRLVHGHRSFRASLEGVEPNAELNRVLDARLERVAVPPEGLILTDYLARSVLDVRPGDLLTVEVLEGRRPVLEVPVAGTTRQYLGVNAYLQRETLNRLMGEGPAISGARLAVDARHQAAVYAALDGMPRIAGTVVRESAMLQFNETMEESILFFAFITALLGGFVAFGVVYNSARIALSERSRELASLRVLGFTRGEVAYILLGELGLLTLLSLPPAFLFGRALAAAMAQAFESDLYRIALVIRPATYSLAAAIILASLLVTAVLTWRKLGRLDLIEVLKTRE